MKVFSINMKVFSITLPGIHEEIVKEEKPIALLPPAPQRHLDEIALAENGTPHLAQLGPGVVEPALHVQHGVVVLEFPHTLLEAVDKVVDLTAGKRKCMGSQWSGEG